MYSDRQTDRQTRIHTDTYTQSYNQYLDCLLYFDLAPPMTTLYGFSGTSIKKSSSIAGHHLTLMFNLMVDDP